MPLSFFVEYNNKAKLKEQNSSRPTEPKEGLAVSKGEGRWGGREKGIEGHYD